VVAEIERARFVAMKDVPQPPLLENTAIMRPFFFGASTCLLERSATRSRTVLSSSTLIGRRKNSRAPALKLRRIRSGEAASEAEMSAVDGHSALRRSMNLSDCSVIAPRAMIAALG